MTTKLILFVALVAQLASSEVPNYDTPYKAADILEDTIISRQMKYYLKGDKPDDAILCFSKQSESFSQFGTDMKTKLEKAGKDLSDVATGETAKKSLENIGASLLDLSQTMWSMIQAKQFDEALQKRQEVGQKVTAEAKTFAAAIEEVRENYPNVAAKAEEKVREIHLDAKLKSKAMSEGIRDCMDELKKN